MSPREPDRWFIIDREGTPTPTSELPARPAEAQDANGDEFRPWFKTTGHLHIEEGRIVGMHSPSPSLEALQASLKKYLKHEGALVSRFGEEDIAVSEADAFLEELSDADDRSKATTQPVSYYEVPMKHCVMIGRLGHKGCISMQVLSNGYDVAVYEGECPKQVERWLRMSIPDRKEAGLYFHPRYKLVSPTPGWALPFIQLLEYIEGR